MGNAKRQLMPVPEYREMIIDDAVKRYGKSHDFWNGALSDRHYFWVADNGIVYEGENPDRCILKPASSTAMNKLADVLLPGHRLLDNNYEARYICLCGSDRFHVWYEGYDVYIECADCGVREG